MSFSLHILGDCIDTHLGQTTLDAIQDVTITGADADGNTTLTIHNSGTLTAANGDTINSSFDGPGTLNASGDVTFEGTETYAGGTGRFADASGCSQLAGQASSQAGTGFFTVHGTISY